MDRDSYADIVVVIGPPKPSVLVLYGSETGVRDSVGWIPHVDIPAEDALVAEDLNNDGTKDLCFVDQSTQSVVAVYGNGDGSFSAPRTIHEGSGVAGLSVGTFTGPGLIDLWFSNESAGTVTLLPNPF